MKSYRISKNKQMVEGKSERESTRRNKMLKKKCFSLNLQLKITSLRRSSTHAEVTEFWRYFISSFFFTYFSPFIFSPDFCFVFVLFFQKMTNFVLVLRLFRWNIFFFYMFILIYSSHLIAFKLRSDWNGFDVPISITLK